MAVATMMREQADALHDAVSEIRHNALIVKSALNNKQVGEGIGMLREESIIIMMDQIIGKTYDIHM